MYFKIFGQLKYKFYLPAFACLMLLIYHSPSSPKEDIKTYTPVILKLLKDREMTCSYLLLFKAYGLFSTAFSAFSWQI